jgi:alpha-L-rhamnosidase
MKKIHVLLLCLLIAACADAASSITVTNLRCEYMHDPLGIDIRSPRFSYELLSGEKNKRQSARQILVATSPELLRAGMADVWDSGIVRSGETNQIALNGAALKPFTYYYWRVAVWDEHDRQSAWSSTAKFSTGAFSASDWKALWIGEDEAAMTPAVKYYSSEGYACDAAIVPFSEKWVVIDLGRQVSVEEIRMHPMARKKKLFPLHFRVELSEESTFNHSVVIAGELSDTVDVAALPYIRRLPVPQSGRYVRLTVTKLPFIHEGVYEYGLAEMEVIANGTNVALGCPVSASDSKIEYRWGDDAGPWHPSCLTDGMLMPEGDGYFKHTPPSPLLRKEISITKKVKHALYHTSALGIYEASINGRKVGRQHLAPEWTDYDHHIQYQTHDVTDMLRNGSNVLGVMLADGWYAGARWSHPGRGGYGGYARMFVGQLIIHYEDGTSDTVVTDRTWKFLPKGAIVAATFFGGEEYDANGEQQGWDNAGYDDGQWKEVPSASPVASLPKRAGGEYILRAQMNEPITVIREIKPLSVRSAGEGKYIFDMGQNMVGWCRISLPYNPGRDIRFRYAEVLNDDGSLYTENMRGANPADIYHPSATGKKVEYEPRFTYHGFRYVEIDGLTQAPGRDAITGKFIASSSPIAGQMTTSDKSVNKLWENIRYTQWGNLISVPTDCPQRDEREGWMGDAQVFAQTAIYNLDMAGFYTKWMRDVRDDQLPDGRLPDISPNDGKWEGFYNAPGWADAGVIIPWRVYQNYNDTTLLAQQYDCMKRFINFIHRHNPDLLWRYRRGHIYGDWLNGDEIKASDYPTSGARVDNDIFATAYFAYSTSILSRTAERLGKQADHRYYSALADAIRKAFVNEYVSDDGTVRGDTQAGYAIALEFGLVPENLREKAAARMSAALAPYDGRMSTGIHTTIRMMNQLSEYGYNDQAYDLLLSRRFPSWLYSIDQGATTIWERWDGYVAGRGFQSPGMNSFNHVAIGAVGEWMYANILGIRYDENSPGYRHIIIRPQPGKRLSWAKGSYRSINGIIEVAWTSNDASFTLGVNIPANTEATILLPNGESRHVGSGRYSYAGKNKVN